MNPLTNILISKSKYSEDRSNKYGGMEFGPFLIYVLKHLFSWIVILSLRKLKNNGKV